MRELAFWPVAVQPLGLVACGTMLWRMAGRLHVTIVVKATLGLEPDRDMTVLAPEPVSAADGDLAPFLSRADVLIIHGFAYASGPEPATAVAVRLALMGAAPVMDKRLLVYGPNPRPGQRGSQFSRVAVVTRGASDGPHGKVLDPRQPGEDAGLGRTTERAASSSGTPNGRGTPQLVRDVLEIPAGLPWDYFQQARADQQTRYLSGDEWLLLDGMQADRPRIASRLPGARAAVRVYPPGGAVAHGPTFEVAMEADRLAIDAEQRRCSLLWRGTFPVADEASARALTLVGALLMPGQAVWAEPGQRIAAPIAVDVSPSLWTVPPRSGEAGVAHGPHGSQRLARAVPEAEQPSLAIDSCDTTRRLRRKAAIGPPGTSTEVLGDEPATRPAAPLQGVAVAAEDTSEGAPETVRYERPGEPIGNQGQVPAGAVTTVEADTRRLNIDKVGEGLPDDGLDTLDGRRTVVRPDRPQRLRPEDLPVTTVADLEKTLTEELTLSVRDVELVEDSTATGRRGPGNSGAG